ncbi:MAG: NUDIX hydrolase [Tetrasphaera sp.]
MTSPAPERPQRRLPAVEERSAGGVVVDIHNGRARIAVIARRNRAGRLEWCLPKGHIERGETLSETAAREVAEETGIEARVLIKLGTIDYWFATGDRRVHKFVHHYLLEATGGFLTIENDPDQEAVDVAWLPLENAHRHLTFPNERRIAREAWQRLAGAE